MPDEPEPDDRTAREILAGILGPPPIEHERQPAERVACLENRLLDAEEAGERTEPLITRPRAKIARLEKTLPDRVG